MRNFLICWCVLALSALSLQAQNKLTDLKKQLAVATTDTCRSRLAYTIGEAYTEVNIDSCLHFLKRSLAIAQRSHAPTATARAMQQLGYTYMYLLKDEATALKWIKKAISVATTVSDYGCLAQCFGMLGAIDGHLDIGNQQDRLNTGLQYALKSKKWFLIRDAYGDLADRYVQQNDTKQALLAYRQGMKVAEGHDLDYWFTLAVDYCELLVKSGQYNKALAFSQTLVTVKHKLPRQRQYFVYANDVARLEIIRKNYAEAERLLRSVITAEASSAHPDSLHLFFTYRNLMTLYANRGDYKNAYTVGQTLTDLRTWLNQKRQTQSNRVQMLKLKATLDIERQTAQIKLLNQNLLISKLKSQQQQKALHLASQQQMMAIVLALLLIVGIAGTAYALRKSKQQTLRNERQAEELSQLNSVKDKLFAIVSHDLRTPLRALQDGLDRLDQNPNTTLPYALPSFQQSVNTLTLLTDNMLCWALLQMGGIRTRPQSFDLNDVVNDVLSLYDGFIKTKNLSLIVRNHKSILNRPLVVADENQAEIIVRNIIQNAIKFSPVGGQLALSFDQQEPYLCLSISDDGPGFDWVPHESNVNQSRPTAKKQRNGVTRPSHESTGLGLVVVEDLLRKNGGAIQVEQRTGRSGAVVRLTWPLTVPEMCQAAAIPAETGHGREPAI